MAEVGGLPGVADGIGDRVVLHVDNDCFYAACERLRDPSLAGEPVVVGMGFEPGSTTGAVATASYEAREYGIESAQAISVAVDTLPPRDQVDESYEGPTGIYKPVDMDYYTEKAADIKAVLRSYADSFRKVSIDEAYLDVTDRTSWENAHEFAAEIQQRISSEIGLPVSIGVAPNMAVAKVASDHDKPEGLVVVPPVEVAEFLADLPVTDLHGVGPKTAGRLHEMDLESVGDLASADRDAIVDRFGERGRELYRRANGIDRRIVEERGDPKSLSRESSFDEAVTDHEVVSEKVTELASAVAGRAADRGATYRTVGIKVVEPPYTVNTREQSLPGPIEDEDIVRNIAHELLAEFEDQPIRKIGVRVSNLSFADGEQSALDSWSSDEATPQDVSKDYHSPVRGQVSLGHYTDTE